MEKKTNDNESCRAESIDFFFFLEETDFWKIMDKNQNILTEQKFFWIQFSYNEKDFFRHCSR